MSKGIPAIKSHFFVKGVECKRCAKCGEIKPLSDFPKCSRSSDKLNSYCKECTHICVKESKSRSKSKKDENPVLIKEGFKRCTLCGEIKPITDFPRDSTKPSGYHCQCKQCRNKKDVEYRLKRKERNMKQSVNTVPENHQSVNKDDINHVVSEIPLSVNKEEIRPDVPMYDNIVVLDHKCKENDKNIRTVKDAVVNIDNKPVDMSDVLKQIEYLNTAIGILGSSICRIEKKICFIGGVESPLVTSISDLLANYRDKYSKLDLFSDEFMYVASKCDNILKRLDNLEKSESDKRKDILIDIFGEWVNEQKVVSEHD